MNYNRTWRFIVCLSVLALAACGGGGSPLPPGPPPPATQTWTATNGTITVTASSAFGAAVTSVVDARGNQYVDIADHGREFQTAYQLDGGGESYNPTEAGSAPDGAGNVSSTVILGASAVANVLETSVHPAYWAGPYNGALASPDTISKRVTVGFGGFANVLRWDVSITLASDHTTGAFEGLTGYGPLFPDAYLQQPDGTFAITSTPDGVSISVPLIEASADGSRAVGVYSPGYTYWNGINVVGSGVDKWDCAWWAQSPLPAGVYSYTCYVAVGTLAEVEAALIGLQVHP